MPIKFLFVCRKSMRTITSHQELTWVSWSQMYRAMAVETFDTRVFWNDIWYGADTSSTNGPICVSREYNSWNIWSHALKQQWSLLMHGNRASCWLVLEVWRDPRRLLCTLCNFEIYLGLLYSSQDVGVPRIGLWDPFSLVCRFLPMQLPKLDIREPNED